MHLQNRFWVSPWNSSWFICLCKLLALKKQGFSFAFFPPSPMNSTLYWTHPDSILIKPTTYKANLGGKSRNMSEIWYCCRLFGFQRLRMLLFRLQPHFPQLFLHSLCLGNSIVCVAVTSVPLRAIMFKNIFHGTYTQSIFWPPPSKSIGQIRGGLEGGGYGERSEVSNLTLCLSDTFPSPCTKCDLESIFALYNCEEHLMRCVVSRVLS